MAWLVQYGAGILVAILYACGCLGGSPPPKKKPYPGSGSRGFVRNPEGYDDEEDDDDEDDKVKVKREKF
jgi:hypothetical protein